MKRALVLLLALPFCGQTRPNPDPGWLTVEKGVEYREAVVMGGATVHQIRCDPRLTRLGLIDAADYKQKKLAVADLTTRSKACAAVNGGYFGDKDEPLGYQRDERRVLSSSVASGGAFGGVFQIGPGGPALLGREDFQPGTATFALQCGPRLIVDGKPNPGLHASPPKLRTGLGVDRQGRLLIFASGGAGFFTFEQCQKWLRAPSAQGGLDPLGVLNLDGGSSTQFSLHTKGKKLDQPGLAPVPIAVGVFLR